MCEVTELSLIHGWSSSSVW